MNYKINIAIAEDHELVRDGFVTMLKGYATMNIVFEADNGRDLLKGLKDVKPDIVLLDIEMPVLSGLAAMEKIRQHYPEVKIIVISAHSEDMEVIEYVKLGARSFLPKHCKRSTLIAAIHAVYEHGRYFDPGISELIAKNLPPVPKPKKEKKLTEREIEFITHLFQGKGYDEIADLMNVVEKTLIWYKHNILIKTGTKNLKELRVYLGDREII